MIAKNPIDKPGNPRVRSPRFQTDRDLMVHSKTIGTSLCYKLRTEDISVSGLLLTWSHNTQVPFLINTLIEMEIDPDGQWLDRPLNCVGKVVRKFGDDSDNGTKFGITIVQMDTNSIQEWESCVGSLERRARTMAAYQVA
jgi:hypothetical protein